MPSKVQHILLADDDPDDVEIFESALLETCPNVQLNVAKNGVELIELLDKLPMPNVIILDLNMPLKSGKECLLEIRKMKRFNRIPIVILSTSGQKADIDFCMSNGANSYLVKPPTYDYMKSIVEMMCA